MRERQKEIERDIEMCVGRLAGERLEREREAVLGRPKRRSVPVFEIPLTAKAISWRWLCCQLLGWLAVKYGGWESAASSPRQPDGWSPRGEEQQQERVGLGGVGGAWGEEGRNKRKTKQTKKRARWNEGKCSQLSSGGGGGREAEGDVY